MSSTHDLTSSCHRTVTNEENLFEWSLLLGRGGYRQACDTSDVKWVYTGVSVFNRVFAARLPDEKTDFRIAETLRYFRSRNTSVLWITSPSNQPADLETRLVGSGMSHVGDWMAMDCDLNTFSGDFDLPDGCFVKQVSDSADMEAWSHVICKGFGMPDSLQKPTLELFHDMGIGESPPWRHYLAYLEGSPAASCTVFFGSSSAGIYLVATSPWARRRGLGSAVTLHAMREAKTRGYDMVILQASQMGQLVYPGIGFRESCRMGLYYLRA